MIRENSGYQDKNGEQIYFGEKVMVNNMKSPEILILEKTKKEHEPYFQQLVYKDTGEFAIDFIYWKTEWGGLPVIESDLKTCEIVK